jgi:iron(III) transport system substrate-binding protein
MSALPHPRALLAVGALALALAAAPVAAQSPSAAPVASAPDLSGTALTIYSGRSESLVGPLLEQFEAATGATVEARYGDSAELAALLLEEGDRSPADVFFSQDAGALGAVSAAGLLAPLDAETVALVPEGFRAADGTWVGTSGRARVLAYSTERLTDGDLPPSVLDLTDPAWKGRIGWAPTNASLQAFVTALRVLQGDEAARAWLEGILANEPVVYEGNTQAVEGIAAGEVDVALVNHYYLLRLIAENGDSYPVANHFFPAGDPGALVNVAGAGALASSDTPDAAAAFVAWLLGPEAESYVATSTFEYPLAGDVAADPRLPDLAAIGSPLVDLAQLADLQGTVALMQEVGALD